MLKERTMTQPTQAEMRALAQDIKDACDAEDAAIDELRLNVAGNAEARALAKTVWLKHNRLHNLLGDLSVMAAQYFDRPPSDYANSGGTDKPRKQEA